MNEEQIVSFIQTYLPMVAQYVLMGLGALVVLGFTYVKATPTEDDDQWLQKLEEKPIISTLLKVLIKFAPIQRKEEAKAEEKKENVAKGS